MPSLTPAPGQPPLEDVVNQIRQRLEKLPATPRDVAEFLAEHGATGQRRRAFTCPLGSWLSADLHACYLLRIDDEVATIIDAVHEGRAGAEIYIFPLPEGVATFNRQYDNGAYPDLVTARPPRRRPAEAVLAA